MFEDRDRFELADDRRSFVNTATNRQFSSNFLTGSVTITFSTKDCTLEIISYTVFGIRWRRTFGEKSCKNVPNESYSFVFAVVTAVAKKYTIFRDVTLCSPTSYPEDGP
jgi:hypothetical protein